MQANITRIVETTDVGDKGQAVASIRIEFKVGEHGPFSVVLPKAGFTAAAANLKIAEFVSHIVSLQGAK